MYIGFCTKKFIGHTDCPNTQSNYWGIGLNKGKRWNNNNSSRIWDSWVSPLKGTRIYFRLEKETGELFISVNSRSGNEYTEALLFKNETFKKEAIYLTLTLG